MRAAPRATGALAWLEAHRAHLSVAALAGGLATSPSVPGGVALAVGVLAFALIATRVKPAVLPLVLALFTIGCGAGQARVAAIDRTAERALLAEGYEGGAVVLQRPRTTRFGSWAIVELRGGPARGSRVLARAGGGERWPAGGEPGVLLEVSGTVARPRRDPSSRLDWPAHLRRRGVAAELELTELRPARAAAPTGVASPAAPPPPAPVPHRGGLAGWVDGVRRRAERGLSAGTAPEHAAVLRGMVLGQDEAIDPLVVDDFRRSGLGHLLAVSGQNVVLLCALALPLLAAAGAGIRGRVACLTALVALYVLVAGAGPSLQRAAAMSIAGLAALAVGRVRSRWYALLVAAALTLAVEPRVAAEPGWQLSFAAVAGILLLAPPLRRRLRALPGPLADGAAMTLAATVATAPIAGHHFEAVSVAGLAANLVALPLVAPIVWLGMVQASLAQAGPPAMSLAAVIGQLNGALAGALARVAEEFASMPGAQVRLPLGSPLAVLAAYAVPAMLWLAVKHRRGRWATFAAIYAANVAQLEGRGRAAGGAWRRAALPRRVAVVALAAALLALGWQRATGPAAAPEHLTVTFLDVGQGDATLIQDGAGSAVLFDAGPPEARVYRLLRRAGVRRLALVVATHASRDHHGGLAEVLREIPTQAIVDGGDGSRDPELAAAFTEARERGARRIVPRADQTITAGRLRIRVLGPPPRPPGPPPDDPNPRALTTVVSAGSFDLFLSGDAESPALLGYDLPEVDAMKVPHHGSADPGLPALLDRLRPKVAAIEVGEGNSYGHPAPSTLAALERRVPHVRRTDEHGTVTLTVRGDEMTLR